MPFFCTGFSHVGLFHKSCFLVALLAAKAHTAPLISTPTPLLACVVRYYTNEPDCALLHILIGKMAASAGKSIISYELLLSLGEERLNGATHNTPVVIENQQHMATCLDSSITRTGV